MPRAIGAKDLFLRGAHPTLDSRYNPPKNFCLLYVKRISGFIILKVLDENQC